MPMSLADVPARQRRVVQPRPHRSDPFRGGGPLLRELAKGSDARRGGRGNAGILCPFGMRAAAGAAGAAYRSEPASPVAGGGRIPQARAQPRPASVPAAGRYSQPTHPSYPSSSMSGSSHA